ncbi:hypothetical protein BGZ63DRAFT_404817 [Mariannaea sp. PMI_226]|nr:hypothetical protein BGZ63DRAFT_404817 [Mariannaea sp. PMI_226]
MLLIVFMLTGTHSLLIGLETLISLDEFCMTSQTLLDLWQAQNPELDLQHAQVYQQRNILLLPQFSNGPVIATLSADTYALLSMAVFFAWNPSTVAPSVPPPQYASADFHDPLRNTHMPNFLTAALLMTANILWSQRARFADELLLVSDGLSPRSADGFDHSRNPSKDGPVKEIYIGYVSTQVLYLAARL